MQFATNKRLKQQLAVKFFVHKSAFEEEKKQYEDDNNPLRAFLPKCRGIFENADGRCNALHT